ncbi:hypothetical protein [Bdellovibrio sp. NC01]|uniref:hypothetical protein n=1 Tax=Bdellovibrio sp. NC01 TaxID=2220073 RepID=UPI001158CCAB|nr:hypothetical protein [Bdellovibrio sp. NC01]QDK37192.1 hypothetical protein DOE51_06115 [Bdellovibrio sp. NC01]
MDAEQVLNNRQIIVFVELFDRTDSDGWNDNPFRLAFRDYITIQRDFTKHSPKTSDNNDFNWILLSLAIKCHLKKWSQSSRHGSSKKDSEKIWCQFCQLADSHQNLKDYPIINTELKNKDRTEEFLKRKYAFCIQLLREVFFAPLELVHAAIARSEWRQIEWPPIKDAWDWALVEFFTLKIQSPQDFLNFNFSDESLIDQFNFLEHYLEGVLGITYLKEDISSLKKEITLINALIRQKIIILNTEKNCLYPLAGHGEVNLKNQEVDILLQLARAPQASSQLVQKKIASTGGALRTALTGLRKSLSTIELGNLLETVQPGERKNKEGLLQINNDFKVIVIPTKDHN